KARTPIPAVISGVKPNSISAAAVSPQFLGLVLGSSNGPTIVVGGNPSPRFGELSYPYNPVLLESAPVVKGSLEMPRLLSMPAEGVKKIAISRNYLFVLYDSGRVAVNNITDGQSSHQIPFLDGKRIEHMHVGKHSAIFATTDRVFTLSGTLDAERNPKSAWSFVLPSFSSFTKKDERDLIPGVSVADTLLTAKEDAFAEHEFAGSILDVAAGWDHFLVLTKA
ncbi:hypothetical protein HDU91_003359, partial [Kappamyces sp. JEL0680]